jgi:hypothetical protein
MQRAAHAFLLLILCLAHGGCHPDEDQPVPPDAAATARLKKKIFVAKDNPSRVLGETEYGYGPDQRLLKSETYSYQDQRRVMHEYTEYTYDTGSQPVRSANYVRHSSGDFRLLTETVFEYAGGLPVRETTTTSAQIAAITYEYAEGRLVKKSFLDGKNKLLHYTVYAYDGAGTLTGETNHTDAGIITYFVQYTYRNGLRQQRQMFSGDPAGPNPPLWSTIRYAYDARNRLVFEKTEYINPLSSAIFPSVRYEYY